MPGLIGWVGAQRAQGAGLALVLFAAGCATAPVESPIAGPAPAVAPAVAPAPVIATPAPTPEAPSSGEAAASRPSPAEAPADASSTRVVDAAAALIEDLRRTSCPKDVAFEQATRKDLAARPISLMRLGGGRRTVGALTLVAAYHLTSTDDRFGGVSGIDLLPTGNLAGVTDQGDLVWIGFSEADGVTPESLHMARMRDTSGAYLEDKLTSDAEGVAFEDGLLFVSLEREHRVIAYDIEACGAAARGAPVGRYGARADMTTAFTAAGLKVGENSGGEALALLPGATLLVGLEEASGDGAPLSVESISAEPSFVRRLAPAAPPIVGADAVAVEAGAVIYTLHRGFGQGVGNSIAIEETQARRTPAGWTLGPTRELADMNVLFNIDNFEGIAAQVRDDGGVRLFIISDDNFSSSQRTLLMVFDVTG
ncbi:hypothetical protein GC169_03635 [bacterium]|nr:hypothetical protein [bacterium]